MDSAVIVDVVRTAGGKRYGALSGWHPADLAGKVLEALMKRTGIDPALVDDVVMGCVTQVGRQAANIGRYAALAAGFRNPCRPRPSTVSAARPAGGAFRGSGRHVRGIRRGHRRGRRSHVVHPDGIGDRPGPPALRGEGHRPVRGPRELWTEGPSVPGGGGRTHRRTWQLSREELDAYGVRSHQLATVARDEGGSATKSFRCGNAS